MRCSPSAGKRVATLRPEFGPDLASLLAPRVGWTASRIRRVLLALATVGVVALGARMALSGGSGLVNDAIVSEPVAFTLGFRDGLERVAPRAGEALRLQTPPGAKTGETFTVSPLELAPYTGDQAGILPIVAAREVARLRKSFPTQFRYRGDGRARINELPGHQLLFQARIDGRLHYGKRYLLLPEVEPPVQAREGVVITLLSRYSKATPSVDAVGVYGLMKGPLRSFRFGTERP